MVKTNHSYSMLDASAVASIATADITEWLAMKPETLEVVNVEGDRHYMSMDIDIVYTYKNNKGEPSTATIEIKGDRWHKTGNFFLETVSNEQKGTPGCFLYSKADYFFYYFMEIKLLYVIPLARARGWFLKNMDSFKEMRTSTPLQNGSHYNTVGRLVPRSLLERSVLGVRRVSLAKHAEILRESP